MVQILDVLVPQVVDQLVGVLELSHAAIPEQVIEVPKILCPSRPLRVALAATQMAEELVEVLVLASVVLAHGRVATGAEWCQVAAPWWDRDPRRDSPPAQGGMQVLGAAFTFTIQEQIVDNAVDVPVIMQLRFQQFCEFNILVPGIQFIVRVLDISVLPQRQVRTVPNCAGDREDFTGAVLGWLVAPVVVQRQVPGMVLTVQVTVVVPQLQSIGVAVDISVVAQRKLPVSLFTVVNMQRQVPAVWVSTLCRQMQIFHRCSFCPTSSGRQESHSQVFCHMYNKHW